MNIIGLDMGVLTGWYQSKINTSLASSTALSSPARSAGAAGSNVLTPWDVRGEVSSMEETRRQVLGSGVFFPKNGEFDDIDAPDDHKKLFDLYMGLKRLTSVAEEAKEKTTADTRRSFLDARLQLGLTQFNDFYDKMDLEGLTLLKGEELSKAQSDVAVSRGKSEYLTGIVHTGDFDAEVSSLTGSVQFNIAVKKNGVTTNIAIDLSEMGATTRNLDNIAAHINSKLEAQGMLTKFARAKIGTADENGVIPGSDYGFKVAGILTEEVSFSATGGQTAVYLAGTSGQGDKAGGQLVKLTGLGGAAPTQAYAKRFDAEAVTTEKPIPGDEDGKTFTTVEPNPLQILASATATDGSQIVVGHTSAETGGADIKGSQDMVLAKYDSTGKQVWTRVLGAADEASAASVAVDSSGNIVVAGKVKGTLGKTTDVGGTDSFVTKYDAAGVEQWVQRFGGTGDDQVHDVAVASDGTVYVAGDSASQFGNQAHQGGATDGYVRAIDTSGTTLYTRRIGSTGAEKVSSIAVASDGALIVASEEDGTAVMRKYASGDGTSAAVWEQTLGDLGKGRIGDVAVDGTNIYFAGSAESGFAPSAPLVANAGGERDAVLVKLTDGVSATVNFTTFLGSDQDETANSVTVADGKVYLGGKTTGSLPGQTLSGTREAFAARFDATTGASEWVTQIGGREGVNEATGVSVVAGGDSILDSLGLPAGKLAYSDTRVVTDRTSARDGDHFYLSVNGGRRKKITIDGDDTMRALTFKINAALILDGNADVRRASAGDQLRITPKEGSTIELFEGGKGQDLLKSLGVKPGAIVGKASLLDEDKSSAAPPLFAMDLPTTISLQDKDKSEAAFEALEQAMSIVRRAYRDLITPQSVKDLLGGSDGPGKRGGGVPAYLSAQVANYSAGLARLNSAPSGQAAFF